MSTCKITYNDFVISETEESGNILIKYNNHEIYSISGLTTGTKNLVLPCSGKYMAGDITIGSKKLKCKAKMMESDIEINTSFSEENTNSVYYLFDSSRNDNFLFGKYIYQPNSGDVIVSGETSWPPSYDYDQINISHNEIILRGKYPSLMAPTGSLPAYLQLQTNSYGLTDPSGSGKNGYLVNNVAYIDNGVEYAPGTGGIPFGPYVLHVKARCTGEGYGYINYDDDTNNQITVSGSELTEYVVAINLISNGFFNFMSTEKGKDLIITDIWLEKMESSQQLS